MSLKRKQRQAGNMTSPFEVKNSPDELAIALSFPSNRDNTNRKNFHQYFHFRSGDKINDNKQDNVKLLIF